MLKHNRARAIQSEDDIPSTEAILLSLLEDRTVVLNGEIDDKAFETVVLPLLSLDDGSAEPIEMYINSPGGDVTTTWAICDAIDNITTPLNKHVLGLAASGGAIVALAGKKNPNVKTTCGKHTTFLVHDGGCGYEGEHKSFLSFAGWAAKQKTAMYDYIMDQTGLTAKDIKKIQGTEYYFGAQEALDLGFVDEVL